MGVISMLGIDLAKNSFSLHGIDAKGVERLQKVVNRKALMETVVKLRPEVVVMEACSGANHWAREFKKHGMGVKLISPQHVKPFVKSQKNDANDARAIVEAASRPSMRYVPAKEIWQQDIQFIHRVRERVIGNRVALVNQIRGILTEFGIVLPLGRTLFEKGVQSTLETLPAGMTGLGAEILQELWSEYLEHREKESKHTKRIALIAKENESSQRLMKVPGVGPIIATIFVASVGEGKEFRNGRHASAWLGVVPRQNSTGGKAKLLGITRGGDSYLRKTIVQGARARVRAEKDSNPWIKRLVEQKSFNKAAVAVANKNIRIMWAILAHKTDYRPAA